MVWIIFSFVNCGDNGCNVCLLTARISCCSPPYLIEGRRYICLVYVALRGVLPLAGIGSNGQHMAGRMGWPDQLWLASTQGGLVAVTTHSAVRKLDF
jgi:hypothetical protein